MAKEKYLFFDLGGYKCRAKRIDAFTQLGLALKLGPMLPALGKIQNYVRVNPGIKITDMDVSVLEILGDALGSLPNDSRDFIVSTMIGAVDRDETGKDNWLPLWDTVRNRPMPDRDGDELDLKELITAMVQVFKHNLSSFMGAASFS